MRKQITLRLPQEVYRALEKDLSSYRTGFAELLDEKGISISELSKKTGISRPALTRYYYGEAVGIQFVTLDKLAEYFGLSVGELISLLRPNQSTGNCQK